MPNNGLLWRFRISGYCNKRPLADAGPVPTAQCIQCGKHFSDKDVLDIGIADHLARYNIQIMSCDVDYAKCAPPTFTFKDNPRSEAMLTFILRDVMMHWWTNCRSCFKHTKRRPKASVCRFFLPVEAQEQPTFIDRDFKINYERAIGAEYFNGNSPFIMKCFADSMDA